MSENPTYYSARAIILDLGQALLREAGMDDEKWAEERATPRRI